MLIESNSLAFNDIDIIDCSGSYKRAFELMLKKIEWAKKASVNISEKLDAAYEDGYETGYLQAEFDYKQEIEELREADKKMHSPGSMQNNSSRRAKWISQPVNYSTIGELWVKWQCSCCGYIRNEGWEHTKDGKKPNAIFCEKCGADMREMNV